MHTTCKAKQAAQPVKEAPTDSKLMDKKCTEIIPDKEDASLTETEINMYLSDCLRRGGQAYGRMTTNSSISVKRIPPAEFKATSPQVM